MFRKLTDRLVRSAIRRREAEQRAANRRYEDSAQKSFDAKMDRIKAIMIGELERAKAGHKYEIRKSVVVETETLWRVWDLADRSKDHTVTS